MYQASEMLYLIKSKIVSLFKLRNILCIFLFIYVFVFTNTIKYNSKYHDEKEIYGKIIDYEIKEDKIKFIIKGKEKIVANFYTEKKNLDIKYGDYIWVYGELSDPPKNTVENNFNYRNYLYNNHIYKLFTISDYKIYKNNNIFYNIKNKVYDRSSKLKSSKYINALLLGNKSLLDRDEINSIKDNGIMHLFAISGMHISILISIINKLLYKTNKHIKNIFIIIFMFIYAFIVGFPASILRVSLCYLIDYILDICNYKITGIKTLHISAFILLIYNPFYIYDLGFLYSYTLMFFLLYFNNKSMLKTGLLTFLVSAPITIYNFYHINILSLFINILAIPIVSLIIFPLTIITYIFPVLDNCLLLVFSLFIKANTILSNIKFLNIVIAKPSIILILLYYYFLILSYKRKISIPFAIIIIFFILNNFNNPYYKVAFLDVSQGDSSLIISPYNKNTIMIDTGGKVLFDGKKSKYYYTENAITYLNSIGINKINYLILTHGDTDHCGEAINLVKNFKVEKVIFNCGEFNDLEQELIKVLDKKNIKYYSCVKELNIDKNKLYFLQTREYDNENDNSNVIYTELNGYKFIFMGDAGVEKEKDILDKYNLSDIDVLKVGHHGSKTSSSKKFINEINPKYSIISVGKNNRYGHPNKEVLNNLENSKIYRTDQDGSIMFKIRNNKLKIETCNP